MRKVLGVILRSLLILAIACFLTFSYSEYVRRATIVTLDIANLMNYDNNEDVLANVNNSLSLFDESFKEIREREKEIGQGIPGSFLGYNLYVKYNNDNVVLSEKEELIDIVFRVNINDNYKEFSPGQEGKLTSFYNSDNLSMEYSFRFFYEDGRDFPVGDNVIFEPKSNSIGMYLKINYLGLVFIFLISLAFSYWIILLSFNIFRFIIFGTFYSLEENKK